MERGQDKILDNLDFNDNLKDSIGSEFIEDTEKSVSQKLRDQTCIYDRLLFDSMNVDEMKKKLERKSTHRNLKNKKNSQTSTDLTRILSVNYTRNESTEISSKQPGSNLLFHSNTNSNNTSFLNNPYEEKSKDVEVLVHIKKYETFKKEHSDIKRRLAENKSEYEKIKIINKNMRKLILSLINHKEDR